MASPHTLREAVQQFATHGTLPSPTTAERGRGNPEHPLHSPAEPSLEDELLIHRRLEDVKSRNLHESTVTLRAALRFELAVDVSKRTLLRWLHELGYRYANKRFVGAVKPACRHARMRQFILDYAAALVRQAAGDTVLVYTDESYAHDRHCSPMLWYNESSPTLNEVQGDDSGGKRLMIVHAMTRNGMLETPGAVGSNLLTERVPTAELIFETLGTDDDYHTAMDGDRYLLWLENRLLPAFAAHYPGKRMTLVLDNAGYHHIHGEDWYTPSQMTVTECVSFLNHHRVRSIDTPRGAFAATTFGRRNKKSAPAPTRPELQAAVRAHLESHPGINRTEVEKLLTKHGHSLIYTPPFTCRAQPIELAWATVKNQVARLYELNRSVEVTREQTEAALAAVTAAQCASYIEKTHAFLSGLMRTNTALNLFEHASFAALVNSLPRANGQAAPMDVD
jgi:hypothetical protein